MRFLAFILCVGTLLWAAPALADDAHKAECASAYEKSQEFRTQNKLQKAQELLNVCAEKSCPTFVQTDCAQWLDEVQKDLPTIVIAAKDKEGADVTAVKVTIDGEVVATELDGKPIVVDPGKHKTRFEMEGVAPVEQPLIAKQGEKDREIKVSFRSHAADGEPEEPAASPYKSGEEPPTADQKKAGPGPLRLPAYIAGGVGALGLVGFVAFGVMGKSQENDLRDRGCAPNCPKEDVDSAKTKYLLADISLGVGIVGIGAGVTLFILSMPKSDKPSDEAVLGPHFDFAPVRGGGYATMSGRF